MSTSKNNIFEAFFWIEPVRSDPKGICLKLRKSFNNTKVLWHYPDDVSNITKEFRDIPQFCFPDLQKMKLEKGNDCHLEHYTFTLTDGEGKRMYGICLRGLFRGVGRRYDVSRRPRHCLCIITKHPYFSMFRTMLLELHSIALIEQTPRCRAFLESIYLQPLQLDNSNVGSLVKTITANRSLIPHLHKDFHLVPPRAGAIANKDVPIVPLFDLLGVDRFFKLFSSVLLERRIIFVADEVDTLSSYVLAAASMLHPFVWHHIFIPLLPSKLLSYVSAPMPYMIGVRKYLLPELRREPLDGVLLVDCDTGELQTFGKIHIVDLIGDSGTALKQATENFDRMYTKAAGMASMLLGSKSSNTGSSSGGSSSGNSNSDEGGKTRDLMAMIINDLKSSIVAMKPGSNSIQSVASGLLRGLPGGTKTEEAKMQWALESEKILRDNIAHFFVHLFADLDEFMKPGAIANNNNTNRGKAASGEQFGQGDSRANFDWNAFNHRRAQYGDSKHIQEFLTEFIHSQMFERFCDDRVKRMTLLKTEHRSQANSGSKFNLSGGNSQSMATAEETDDLFDGAIQELKSRQLQNTVPHAKQAVLVRSNITSGGNSSESGLSKVVGTNFHALTLQFTSSSLSLPNSHSNSSNNSSSNANNDFVESNGDDDLDSSQHMSVTNNNLSLTNVLERIIGDANYSDAYAKIMNTITFRIEACRVAGCRGNPGIAGIRALSLLRTLLLLGPECTLSYSLDLISNIRQLIKLSSPKLNSSNQQSQLASQALEFMSIGSVVDARPYARVVLSLLLDHNKLVTQQKYETMKAEGYLNHLNASKIAIKNQRRQSMTSAESTDLMVSGPQGVKSFPSFHSIHLQLNQLNLPPISDGILKITPPELLVAHTKEEDDEDDNVNTPGGASTTTGGGSAVTIASTSGKNNYVINNRGNENKSITPVPATEPSRPFSNSGSHSNLHSAGNNRSSTNMSPKRGTNITPPPAQVVKPKPTTVVKDLLSFDDDISNDNNEDASKYRVVNKDTGDVMDIRKIAKIPQPVNIATSSNNNNSNNSKSGSGFLPPPPNDTAGKQTARGNTTANKQSNSTSTPVDPFSSSADPWATTAASATNSNVNKSHNSSNNVSISASPVVDPFAFNPTTTATNNTANKGVTPTPDPWTATTITSTTHNHHPVDPFAASDFATKPNINTTTNTSFNSNWASSANTSFAPTVGGSNVAMQGGHPTTHPPNPFAPTNQQVQFHVRQVQPNNTHVSQQVHQQAPKDPFSDLVALKK